MSDSDRPVATDALATLGTIIGEHEKRDAIHLAVEPAVAAHTLGAGEHVGFVEGGRAGFCENTVGIVDPFLVTHVKPGERFWLIVYPRQITSLRHVWTHPGFPEEGEKVVPTREQKEASEAWLRDFVARSDCPGYDTVLAAATGQHHLNDLSDGYNYSKNDGEYLHFNGSGAHGEIPPEFWDHVSVVCGRTIPQHVRATYFSCSC